MTLFSGISAIEPVRFRFKEGSNHPKGEQIGLIAQDVRKEFPDLVHKGTAGYLSLAYPKMTAVLLNGLQEQQTRIERHRSEIDSLEDRVQQIEDLRKRIAQLEAKSKH